MAPSLDVTGVLSCPAFSDDFGVTRSVQTVGDDGIAVNKMTTLQASGVVAPSNSMRLVRDPSGEMVVGDLDVITTFPLTAGTAGRDADLVTYQGNSYIVISVDSYLAFGAGFVRATTRLRTVQAA